MRRYQRISNKRYCTGYRKSAYNWRSLQDCANWVRKIDPYARWFFYRHQPNHHCAPCPRTYRGHPTTGTAYQNSRIYIYRIIHWRAPTFYWQKWYRRVAFNRFCTGYKNNNHSFRKVEDCGRWVRQKDPEARYFFFRSQSNWHCASCPLRYTGGKAGTSYQNSEIYVYRILNWRPPNYKWRNKYRRHVNFRYCSGYKKTNYKTRTVEACANWVRMVDSDARYFFFRHQSNWHCSPCPQSYRGHQTTGTHSDTKTRIYIYRILNWRPPAYFKWYRRVTKNRYCTGYKKSAFNHRSVPACANWVKKIDREARWFFFRHEGNYHCSPCPLSYRGHATTGTGYQNSEIYVYRIIGWRAPTYGW